MSALYKETIQAKNGAIVPVYNSGKPAHSKYNPEQEALGFLPDAKGLLFALVFGAGGGFHIASLLERNPGCKALVVEKSEADLDFLKRNVPCVSSLFKKPNVLFCAAEVPGQMERLLLENYLPAWSGDLQMAALRSWAGEAGGLYESLLERAKNALKEISADYSVQARFGGLWQRNIFCNLKVLQKTQERKTKGAALFDQTKIAGKTAAIIAAGPSLDKSVQKIQESPEKYWTIATDTGWKILSRLGIRADAVVSIDAQRLSAEHFIAPICKDTIFVLDLAANPSIANKAYESGAKILFANCGHPLISFASSFCERPFLRLASGGGTVAIAAADFAKNCGFEKIEIFGADFGYSCGKPYAQGSYLDDLYRSNESLVQNAESAFSRLMFRTPLKKNADGFLQNDVMLSYQKSLEGFLQKENFTREDNVWKISFDKSAAKREAQDLAQLNRFDFFSFKAALLDEAKKIQDSDELSASVAPLLPGIAWIKARAAAQGQNAAFGAENKISTKEAKKLALNKILLYNSIL